MQTNRDDLEGADTIVKLDMAEGEKYKMSFQKSKKEMENFLEED